MPTNHEHKQIEPFGQSPELEPVEGLDSIDATLMSLQLAVSGYLNMDKRSREMVQRSTEMVLAELANTRSECRRIADRANRKQANMLRYHRREIARTVIVGASLAVIALWFLLALTSSSRLQ